MSTQRVDAVANGVVTDPRKGPVLAGRGGSDDDEVGTEVHGDIDGSRKFRAPTPVKSSSIPRVAPTRGVRARHQKGAASSPVEGG